MFRHVLLRKYLQVGEMILLTIIQINSEFAGHNYPQAMKIHPWFH